MRRWLAEPDTMLTEIEEFLTGGHGVASPAHRGPAHRAVHRHRLLDRARRHREEMSGGGR